MATDHVKMFAQEYAPIAVQVSQQTGIAPSVLLAQWGMETDYGRKTVGHFNFGNIKDMSGAGTPATDNQTGSRDKYVNFESPEAFGDYYSHMMRRLYPNALNAGTDISKYAEGLRTGVKGSYAEDENYEDAIRGAHKTTIGFYKDPEEIPTVKPMTEAERIKIERQEAGTTEEPPKPEPKEIIDPATGALAGAGFSALGQVPFEPQMPTKIDPAKAREKYATARDAAQLARQNLQNALPEGSSYAELEDDFKRAQRFLDNAKNEYVLAEKMAKMPPPPTPPAISAPAPAAPVSRTTPGDPGAVNWVHSMVEGVPETVANKALNMRADNPRGGQFLIDQDMLAREKQAALGMGNFDLTKTAGGTQLILPPEESAKIEGELSARQADDAAREAARLQQAEYDRFVAEREADMDRRMQQQRMDALRQQRATAGQQFQEANTAMKTAGTAQAGVSKAETAQELAARQLARTKGQPSMVTRPLEVAGVKAGKAGIATRAGIGAIGGLQAARGLNELANMPIEELLKRYQAGERSPELLAAIQQAAGATAQTGFGAAATVPVIGPKTAKIKGAGAIGTGLMGAYEGYKALTEKAPQ